VKGEVIWEKYATAGHILTADRSPDREGISRSGAGMQPPKGDYD
jgi:hypothetical protein